MKAEPGAEYIRKEHPVSTSDFAKQGALVMSEGGIRNKRILRFRRIHEEVLDAAMQDYMETMREQEIDEIAMAKIQYNH